MRKLLLVGILLSALCFMAGSVAVAQVPKNMLKPTRWVSLGATTRFAGTGLSLAYGQRDLLGENADARFWLSYYSPPPYAAGYYSFELEAEASAISATYEPDTLQGGLFLVPYGGLGPRLLVRVKGYELVDYYGQPETAILLNVGAVGGLEARLRQFGMFLELDVSLPALALVGPRFRVFPFEVMPAPRLTLGANYYF